jgi:hypothetical protein
LNACHQQVEIKCECGRFTALKDCKEVRKLYDEKMKKMQKEHLEKQKEKNAEKEGDAVEPIVELEILPYSVIGLPPLLECDKECKRIRRIKQLANAFEIDFEKREMPEYSEELQIIARRNVQTLTNIERAFDDLILLNSKERASYQFPRMNKERRNIVHALATAYGLEAVSIDPEPYRSVVVTKSLKSARPMILLSEVIHDPNKAKILKEKLKEKKEQEELEEEKEKQANKRVYEDDGKPKVVEFHDEDEHQVTKLPTETNVRTWKDVHADDGPKKQNFWDALGDDEDQ